MRKPRDPLKEGSTTAREIMTPYVIKLGVDALFEDVIKILYEYVITAVFLYDEAKDE